MNLQPVAAAALVMSVAAVLFHHGDPRRGGGAGPPRGRRSTPAWAFTRRVDGIEVRDSAGRVMPQPFIGGFNQPRPQLVDLHGNGKPDLFVQEVNNNLVWFERVGDTFVWRTDKYQGLDLGEWFRFSDMNGDGLVDLLGEQPTGYIRVYRNAGSKTEPRFVPAIDTLKDADGVPIFADPQNILNVVDIDCNGKLDLFIGRVTGTVDRFEEDSKDSGGFPRFRLLTEQWEGIEILGPTPGVLNGLLPDRSGPPAAPEPPGTWLRHGANTMAFGDIEGRGVLDLFWGDFFEPGLLLIRNDGNCEHPSLRGDPRRFPYGPGAVLTSGYNAATVGDVDGDGIPDVVMGVVGGAYQPNHTSIDNLYFIRQGAPGRFNVVTKRLIPMIDVGSESVPALGDIDGDGDLDLLIGNKIAEDNDTTGSITWFENVGTRTAPVFRDRGIIPGIHGRYNYAPAIVDLDGDGLPDLVVGTWTDRVEWYRNTGVRGAARWTLADTALITLTRGSNTVPTVADIDGDGRLDMLVGAAVGRLSLYRNTGTRTAPKFELVSDHFQDIKFGRRSAPLLVDMDGDGRPDLLIGDEEGKVELWRNTSSPGTYRFELDTTFSLATDGLAAPAAGDLRGTGRPDILLGGAGGGLRWFSNESHAP